VLARIQFGSKTKQEIQVLKHEIQAIAPPERQAHTGAAAHCSRQGTRAASPASLPCTEWGSALAAAPASGTWEAVRRVIQHNRSGSRERTRLRGRFRSITTNCEHQSAINEVSIKNWWWHFRMHSSAIMAHVLVDRCNMRCWGLFQTHHQFAQKFSWEDTRSFSSCDRIVAVLVNQFSTCGSISTSITLRSRRWKLHMLNTVIMLGRTFLWWRLQATGLRVITNIVHLIREHNCRRTRRSKMRSYFLQSRMI